MDDFILLLYCSWIVFIIVLFFTQESNKRFYLTIWILGIISSAKFTLTINQINIMMPFLILIIGSMIFYVIINQQLSKLVNVFLLMITVVAILLWQLLMPASYILTTIYFLPVIILLLSMLLARDIEDRITLCLMGASFGQLLYDIIVMGYGLSYMIGSERIFIQICIIVLNLLIIHFIQIVFSKNKQMI